jgi:hypothetical protein
MRSISRRNSVSEGVSVRGGFVMVLLRARDRPLRGAALIGGATRESKENIDSVALRPI